MPGEPRQISRDALNDLFESVKNWGRWGPDDQRGTLNLVTPAKALSAAALVREGVSVSASLPLATTPGPFNPTPVTHLMLRAGDVAGATGSADYFAIAPHGMANTHLDALCHIFYRGQMYNGFPQSEVTSTGALKNAISAAEDGIVTRGVLLDLPRLLDRDWLEPAEAIYRDDLEKAEAVQGVTVEPGDVVFVRTGRHARDRAHPPVPRDGLAGLDTDCLPWVYERGVAVLGCDGVSDVMPSGLEGGGLPVHSVVIPATGVHIVDNADLEPLAAACARFGRWQFMLTIASLRLPRGTASPVNPIAIF